MSSSSDPKQQNPTSPPPAMPSAAAIGYPAASTNGAVPAPTSTAYTYPAQQPPPPQQQAFYYAVNPNAPPPVTAPPQYYYPNPSAGGYSYNYGRGSVLLRRLLTFAVAFFLLVGVATFIAWLVLRPRVPSFVLSSAAISGLNVSAPSTFSASFDVTFIVSNPNTKLGVQYYDMDGAVFYGGDLIAQASLRPLYQQKGNSTSLPVQLAAVNNFVPSASKISTDRSSGTVRFHFRIVSWVVFNSGWWRTRPHGMQVLCEDVPVLFGNGTTNSGLFSGPAKQCLVAV